MVAAGFVKKQRKKTRRRGTDLAAQAKAQDAGGKPPVGSRPVQPSGEEGRDGRLGPGIQVHDG